jgi:hypothetical protein
MPRVALGRDLPTPADTCRYTAKRQTMDQVQDEWGIEGKPSRPPSNFFSACATHCRRLVVPAAFRMPILRLHDDLSFSLPPSLAPLFHMSSELERGRWAKMPATVARATSPPLKVWKLVVRASMPDREMIGVDFRRVLVGGPRMTRCLSGRAQERARCQPLGWERLLLVVCPEEEERQLKRGRRYSPGPDRTPHLPSCASSAVSVLPLTFTWPGRGDVPHPACALHSGLFC